MKAHVETPDRCRGPLSECLRNDPSLTEAQWHRGQMRGYASLWRRRRVIAAAVGIPMQMVSEDWLFLARVYRDHALRLEESGGERQFAATSKGGVA